MENDKFYKEKHPLTYDESYEKRIVFMYKKLGDTTWPPGYPKGWTLIFSNEYYAVWDTNTYIKKNKMKIKDKVKELEEDRINREAEATPIIQPSPCDNCRLLDNDPDACSTCNLNDE